MKTIKIKKQEEVNKSFNMSWLTLVVVLAKRVSPRKARKMINNSIRVNFQCQLSHRRRGGFIEIDVPCLRSVNKWYDMIEWTI